MTTTARGKALRASPFAPYEFDHKKRKEVTEQGKAYTYPQPTITASASTPGSPFKRRGGSVLLRRGHFCHNCAHQLVDASTFNLCLDTSIAEVPGLTDWQRKQIKDNLPFFKTIRDYLAKQDPAAELLTVSGFGKSRTARIVDVLNSFVDDYLS